MSEISPPLEVLAVLHRPRVRRTAFRFVRDADLADDITQEVFIRLQRSLDGFRHEAQLTTWLHTVTLNLARDHLRKRARQKREVNLEQVGPHPSLERAPDPTAELERERTRAALRAALERLPPEQARAIRLRYLEERPFAEVAAMEQISVGTVASRVFRGLKRLGQDHEIRHLEITK